MSAEKKVMMFSGERDWSHCQEVYPQFDKEIDWPPLKDVTMIAISFIRAQGGVTGFYVESMNNTFEELEIITPAPSYPEQLVELATEIAERFPDMPKIWVHV